jgi:endoglucanase
MDWDREQERSYATKLLRELTEAHAAPGSEQAVRRIFRERLQERCAGAIEVDRAGNIFAVRQGTAEHPRIMLAAHMDEVALAVQAITAAGLLKVVALGGWWPPTLLAKRVRVLTGEGQEILGVVAAKPPHLLTDAERDKTPKLEDLFVDVGATSVAEVRDQFGIGLGDPIVPDSPLVPLQNPDLLLAKAFDDRTGVALLIQVLRGVNGIRHPNTLIGVGTVQEEVGVRGAQTAVFSASPEAAIVIEGAPADDFPGTAEEERQGVLGRGPQIRLLDPSAIMNRRFVQYLLDTAERHHLPYQAAVRRSGATDARAIQLHDAGVPTVVIGVPARYIHTHNSMIHLGDYLHTLQLLARVIEGLDRETVESFSAS